MTTHTVDVATPAARPWRLGGKTRKGVLVLHVGSAGAWLGVLVLAMVLSVYKPWGRIRKRKRQ